MTPPELPEGTVGSEHLGVRVFSITAPDTQILADRLAVTLGEHMASDDQIHLSYNVIQSGWQHDPGRSGWRAQPPHTQLFFEHSVMLVLRPREPSADLCR